MARVKRGFKGRRRHKRILKMASGYRGTRSRLFRTAVESVEKALVYAYRDRKVKKRDFRKLWITRLNAAARLHGLSYSVFMNKIKASDITLDRKSLSELAVSDPDGFATVVKSLK